jgi:hypothetical protein
MMTNSHLVAAIVTEHLALRRGDLPGARRLLPMQLAVADERGWVPPEQVHDLLAAGLRAGLPVGELRPLVARANRGGHRPLAVGSPWRRLLDAQVAGLTNSQLAERLYISPRTAAVHVSNILAKLGMSSRTEVAAWAVREGLAASPRHPETGPPWPEGGYGVRGLPTVPADTAPC